MDLTATILAATGTPVPSQAGLEGMNLMPVLERRAPVVERTLFWRVTGIRPQQAVRMGDWKLLLDGGRAMLFDLHSDIGERANLIAQRSDVARRLHGLLAAWEDSVNAEAKRATGAGEAR
jgi:arylsulfatase A-like enzyme